MSIVADADTRAVIVVPAFIGDVLGFGWDDSWRRAEAFVQDLKGHLCGEEDIEVTYGYSHKSFPDGSSWWYHAAVEITGWAAAGVVGNSIYAYLKRVRAERVPVGAPNPDDLVIMSHGEAESLARWIVCAEFHDETTCDCFTDWVNPAFPSLRVVTVERNGDEWAVTLEEYPWRYVVRGMSGDILFASIRRERING